MLYRFLNLVIQPFTLLFLLIALALINLWRDRSEQRLRLLTFLFVALTLLSLPPVSYLAIGSLEWGYPRLTSRPAGVDAIVVLAGGASFLDATHRQAELDSDTLYRCIEAAAMYHRGWACPVIVSGGSLTYPQTPDVALQMRDYLITAGVSPADLIVEDRSRTTFESAVEVRKLMDQRRFRKMILVTEAFHMRRSLACYEKQHIRAVPAACHHRAGEFVWTPSSFLPNPTSAQVCLIAWHEYLGTLWYRIHGRI